MELSNLLSEIEQGRYALPEIQRPYVWRNQQVLELFDSIRQNFPIGSILVWNMPREFVDDYNDLLRPLTDDLDGRRSNFQYMVIDGQQRLVSIYLVKKGSVTINEKTRKIFIYFDPTSAESPLKLGLERDYKEKCYWFKVSDILSYDTISEVIEKKVEIAKCDEIMKNKHVERSLERFRTTVLNYPIHIYQIPEGALRYNKSVDNFLEILEKISEIFVRLNSTGTRIRMTDLVTAVLTAKTRTTIKESFRGKFEGIDEYFEEMYQKRWDINEPVLMRTYLAIATDKTSFREARNELENLTPEKILESIEYTKKALEGVVDTLIREWNIKEIKFLKSQYSLVTLAYYFHKKQHVIYPEDIKQIGRWLLLSSFEKRYTGRLESDLNEDIKLLSKEKSLKALEEALTYRDFSESLIDGTYDKEHVIALLMILKDGFDLIAPFKRIREIEEVEIHHIFPKDVLKKVYGEKIGDEDVETVWDYVANITITSKEANRAIGTKRPDEYLRNLSSDILESHCIPADTSLWRPENYEEFVAQRRKKLVSRIKTCFNI